MIKSTVRISTDNQKIVLREGRSFVATGLQVGLRVKVVWTWCGTFWLKPGICYSFCVYLLFISFPA